MVHDVARAYVDFVTDSTDNCIKSAVASVVVSMATTKGGNTVVVGNRHGKTGAYTDLRQPNGGRFRILDKSVSDEAKRRAASVLRDQRIGRLIPAK